MWVRRKSPRSYAATIDRSVAPFTRIPSDQLAPRGSCDWTQVRAPTALAAVGNGVPVRRWVRRRARSSCDGERSLAMRNCSTVHVGLGPREAHHPTASVAAAQEQPGLGAVPPEGDIDQHIRDAVPIEVTDPLHV